MNSTSDAHTENNMSPSTSVGAVVQTSALPSFSFSTQQARIPPQGRPLPVPRIDANILSCMVAASANGLLTGAGDLPTRVASIQDFRRSVERPTNRAHPTSNVGQNFNTTFALSNRRATDPHVPVPGAPQMNPMLRMLEERMAASASARQMMQNGPIAAGPVASPIKLETPAATPEQQAALQAAISKWAGIGSNVKTQPSQSLAASKSFHMTNVMPSVCENNSMKSLRVPQVVSSPAQDQRCPATTRHHRLTSKQQEILQNLLLEQQQADRRQQSQVAAHVSQGHPSDALFSADPSVRLNRMLPSGTGLVRCSVSLADVVKHRHDIQSLRLLQQQEMHARLNEKYPRQRFLPTSVLSSSNPSASVQEDSTKESLKTFKRMNSYRKRASQTMLDDEEDEATTCTSTSQSHSVSSHASSTSKVRRSSYANFSASIENLRIESPSFNTVKSLSNMKSKNQSFSCELNALGRQPGVNVGSSASSKQNFSADVSNTNRVYHSGLSSSHLHGTSRSATTMKRIPSRNSAFVSSLLHERHEVSEEPSVQPGKSNDSVATNKSQSPPESKPAPSPKIGIDHHLSGQQKCAEKIIMSDLPDRMKYQTAQAESKPIDIVRLALESRGVECNEIKSSLDMPADFFVQSSESYCQEAVDAIRSGDIDLLRKLLSGGTNLQCANRFGESLIHMACRRSHRDVVSFLVNEAGVSLRVRDDYGRTPFHDACWRAELDLELIDMLLEKEPKLLLLSDKRGHSPLDYTRRGHWAELMPFLLERSEKFQPV
ncbi:hypothetical protein HJC23_001089 [Cyclotella cryptica]|uniref:Uncharacterized protein n=1 Tax=Cyclotella cryptica TaxID=29204 RepID=A0ABD3QI97_9STRA|eukprot:CCRYP_005052-RA/>CCRYP_005052-RA protein AED:0.08 eAED:0.08 QI:0/-1/0/1/-1/1/1/0/772